MAIDVLQAVVLGIVQGITEWLPVSSSGHLAVLHHFMGIGTDISFDIALHFASLLVVLFIFRGEVVSVLRAFFRMDFKSEEGKLALFVIVGSIPTAIIGFAFRGFFESMFYSVSSVGTALIITGFLIILTKLYFRPREMDFKKALFVGAMQGCAVAPGISRSGATITASLMAGLDREKAVRFSFLLFIPAIIGATLFSLNGMASFAINPIPLVAGMIASALVGYASVRLLIKLVINRKLHWFSLYCWAAGLLLILISI